MRREALLAHAAAGSSVLGDKAGPAPSQERAAGKVEGKMIEIAMAERSKLIPARKTPLHRRIKDAWLVLAGKAHACVFR